MDGGSNSPSEMIVVAKTSVEDQMPQLDYSDRSIIKAKRLK